jgi:hypothetical protein
MESTGFDGTLHSPTEVEERVQTPALSTGLPPTPALICIPLSLAVQSNSADYELLFWQASGSVFRFASKLRDVTWASFTCTLGWPVQGTYVYTHTNPYTHTHKTNNMGRSKQDLECVWTHKRVLRPLCGSSIT